MITSQKSNESKIKFNAKDVLDIFVNKSGLALYRYDWHKKPTVKLNPKAQIACITEHVLCADTNNKFDHKQFVSFEELVDETVSHYLACPN